MRVAVDATSVLLRSAGVKNYVYHWIRHMRQLAGAHEILAFPFLGDLGALDHQRSVLGFLATYARLGLLHFVNVRGNPAIDWILPRADIFHASNLVRNAPRRRKLTATVYDMTCRLMPEMHTEANVRAERSFAERVLRRADGLIAISENTKADLLRFVDVPPDRVTVIYPGVAQTFFDAQPGAARRYGIAKPYVLFVGTIEPRKNVDTLLNAWNAVNGDLRDHFELVIAGPMGWASENTAGRLKSGSDGVRYVGYVDEGDLPSLTAGASVFVYPSLYEGFGFPVAQAMAAGVPVVTSNGSSLPEVAGDAALLADPKSPAELSSAIERLLLSEGLRERLSEEGRKRAERFRWEHCARESLHFFETVAGT